MKMRSSRFVGFIAGGVACLSWGGAHADNAACVAPDSLARTEGVFSFVQTRELVGVDAPIVSSGVVEFKPDLITWTVSEPIEIVTRITPQGVTQSVDGGEPTSVGAVSSPMFARSGVDAMLRGDFDGLSANYEMERGNTSAGWVLRLTPLSEDVREFISEISLTGCSRIDAIRLVQANGDVMKVAFAE